MDDKKVRLSVKLLLVSLFLLCSLTAGRDIILRKDKLYHLGVCSAGVGAGYELLHNVCHMDFAPSIYLPGITMTLVSVLKEVHDKNQPHNHFSRNDLIADAVGIGAMTAIIVLTHKEKHKTNHQHDTPRYHNLPPAFSVAVVD